MINRYYPFGYQLLNGKAVLEESEARNVREIFRAYLSGNSFKEIAQTLICAQAEYLPGKTDWNKNRVARILADSRYCGENGFPQIVKLSDFEKVKAIRAGKQSNQASRNANPITSAAAPIYCGACGSQTIRRNDKRFRYQQKHICMNPNLCCPRRLSGRSRPASCRSKRKHHISSFAWQPIAASLRILMNRK